MDITLFFFISLAYEIRLKHMDFTEAKAHKEFRNMDLGPLYAFFRGNMMFIQWECLLLNLLIEILHKLSAKTLHIYFVF